MILRKPYFNELAKKKKKRANTFHCYLGNANTIDPLLEGSDVITAKVLDVLRLLLDLRMLQTLQS